MTVVGSARQARGRGIRSNVLRDELEQAVRELDYLVLLTPYSAATRGIVGEKVLAAMKAHRPTSSTSPAAAVVDEAALIRVLQERAHRRGRAGVFAQERCPRSIRLWGMERCWSRHLGASATCMPTRRCRWSAHIAAFWRASTAK